MTKVHKKRIQKWVDALRSGIYKQGDGSLIREDVDDDGEVENIYCCLGVACDIYNQATGDGKWSSVKGFKIGKSGNNADMPKKVFEYFGFDTSDPVLSGNPAKGERTATEANDNYQWSFKKIATAIKKRYLK